MQQEDFAAHLLDWHRQHGRHDLPWQHPRTAYRVWVSEIMLQQTQVSTVIPYFENFMKSFPDVATLAAAAQDNVLHHWSGLGYYARARNLHRAAQLMVEQHQSQVPTDFESLLALPGIGRSTAGAILAQATGQRFAILDGNVKRLLARYHGVEGWPGQARVSDQLWQYAEQHTPDMRLADYTQALMDMGATLCRRSRPLCDACPLAENCMAYQQDRVNELPTRKPRKEMPVKAARLLVLKDDEGRILLEKRPSSGIWGGLWSLPECESHQNPEDLCRERWQLKTGPFIDGISFRHTFSHYHFDITPCYAEVKNPYQCVMEDERVLWYNSRQSSQLGLAAPIQAILEQINEV